MTDNREIDAKPHFSIDLDKFQVHGDIFIDMDQSTELVQLNYLLKLVNFTVPENSSFNFSHATAMGLIREYMDKMYTLGSPTTIALICLYLPVFLLSLGGNGLVVFVVFCNPHMRRVKNIFLVNLAFADLLVTLICMPMVVGQIVFRLWVYGEFMCKLSGYMQGVAVSSSIFTLTALSIDRYLAIKSPLSSVRRGGSSGHCQAVRFLLAIWFLAAVFICPILYVRSVYEVDFDAFQISMRYCIESWTRQSDRRAYALFLLIITYVLPFGVITTCYVLIGRTLCSGDFHRKTSDSSSTVMLGRKRVARMLIVLIAVFVACWLPYNVCSLSLDLNLQYEDTRVLPFALWFGHAHSAVNPVLYWYLNKSFRYCMQRAMRCETLWRRGQRDSPSPHPGAIGEILRFDFRRRKNQHHQGAAGDRCHSGEIEVAEEPGEISSSRMLHAGVRDHGPRPSIHNMNAGDHYYHHHHYERRPRSASTPSSCAFIGHHHAALGATTTTVQALRRGLPIEKQQSGRIVRIVFSSNNNNNLSSSASSRLPTSTATSRLRQSGATTGSGTQSAAPLPDASSTVHEVHGTAGVDNATVTQSSTGGGVVVGTGDSFKRSRRRSLPVSVEHVLPEMNKSSSAHLQDDFV